MVNQAILTKDAPLADVLYGVDNTFLSRALDAGIFDEYTSSVASTFSPDLNANTEGRVTPIDYGDVCINIDKGALAADLPEPSTLESLTQPSYAGQARRREPGDVLARTRVPDGHHRPLRRGRGERLHVARLLAGARSTTTSWSSTTGTRPTTRRSPAARARATGRSSSPTRRARWRRSFSRIRRSPRRRRAS